MKQHAKNARFTTLSIEELEGVSGGANQSPGAIRLEILRQQQLQESLFGKAMEKAREEAGQRRSDAMDPSDSSGGDRFNVSENESDFYGWDSENASSFDTADAGDSWFGDSGSSFSDWG